MFFGGNMSRGRFVNRYSQLQRSQRFWRHSITHATIGNGIKWRYHSIIPSFLAYKTYELFNFELKTLIK